MRQFVQGSTATYFWQASSNANITALRFRRVRMVVKEQAFGKFMLQTDGRSSFQKFAIYSFGTGTAPIASKRVTYSQAHNLFVPSIDRKKARKQISKLYPIYCC